MQDLTYLIDSEIEFSASRSSGKGGQNVNKTNSKAELRWNLDASPVFSAEFKARFRLIAAPNILASGEVVLTSQESRDYRMNVGICMEKLNQMLVQATHIPRKRVKTKPTRSSQRRRLDSKKRHQDKKKSRQRID
ncbi:MAG: aminoacyl-tRNA hydrolase [Bdellovibrionales bacterium]|nr:aminoacyl-tRNA hydrolase [Bdellovibrionales bacterium]